MTRRIHPAISVAAVLVTVLAGLLVAFLAQPARAVPVAPAAPTPTICTDAGACVIADPTPFRVTRPAAIAPTPTTCVGGACITANPVTVTRPAFTPPVLPGGSPPTTCTVDACLLNETTPFSVVRPS